MSTAAQPMHKSTARCRRCLLPPLPAARSEHSAWSALPGQPLAGAVRYKNNNDMSG